MSAMITWPSAVRPPAPMPWTARQAMSKLGVAARSPPRIEAEHEDHDAELDEQLAVEQVGELAPDRRGDGRA